MKTLLELLGQELHNQVAAKLGEVQIFLHEKDQKVILDDGKMVPQHRVKELTDKVTSLETQLSKSETDLKELKKSFKDNEALTSKIEELQTENKNAKSELVKRETQLKKELAVKEALMSAGVVDADARDLLLPKFDVNTIELDEAGKVKDFDSKLKPIKENKTLSVLFGEIKFKGTQPAESKGLPEGLFTREQVNAMPQSEVNKNYAKIQESMNHWNTVNNNSN